MRVLGCGWTQYATRWSSKADSRIGTVAHLQTLLEEIVAEEKSRSRFTAGTDRGLPTEAVRQRRRSTRLASSGSWARRMQTPLRLLSVPLQRC